MIQSLIFFSIIIIILPKVTFLQPVFQIQRQSRGFLALNVCDVSSLSCTSYEKDEIETQTNQSCKTDCTS